MKIKNVQLTRGGTSLACWHKDRWVPLVLALEIYAQAHKDLQELHPVAGDMPGFLRESRYRDMALGLMDFEAVKNSDFEGLYSREPLLPFQPLSYRDFMLFEQHYINAARGMVRRFLPKKMKFLRLYEKIFRKIPRALYPKKIWYEKPIYYMGNHLAFVPHNAPVTFPAYATVMDYELELGVLVTRPLYNADAQTAREAIGGFCILNDFSARNVQLAEMGSGFGPVKAKNFANSISEVVVTPDELPDSLNDLTARVYINNELKSSGTIRNMQFSLAEALAYASLGEQIYPGEFFGSGTIPGCCGIETGFLLAPGDSVTLEIEKIGSLTNKIVK